MPERMLRPGILTSDAVNRLTFAAEVFYRRLMSVVDDFGRFDGRAAILRANLYPLKLGSVVEPDVEKWLTECVTAGLVRVYEVEGKRYVMIEKFDQRLRAQKSKWPSPVSSLPQSAGKCPQPSASRGHPLTNASETETESESETKSPFAREAPGEFDQSGTLAENLEDVELEQIAQSVQVVTGLKASSWQIEGLIKTAAIELKGQGFSAEEILLVARQMGGKTYRVRFLATDLAKDRADLANGAINEHRGNDRNQAGLAKSSAKVSGAGKFRAKVEL